MVLADGTRPERLILDGQQRLTSLTQVLKLTTPVATQDSNKREIKRHYYFDIDKALSGPATLDDAIVGVPEDRVVRKNIGRDVVLDLSSPEKEYAAFCFPCSQILNFDAWEVGLNKAFPDRFGKYMEFQMLQVRAPALARVPSPKTSRRRCIRRLGHRTAAGSSLSSEGGGRTV